MVGWDSTDRCAKVEGKHARRDKVWKWKRDRKEYWNESEEEAAGQELSSVIYGQPFQRVIVRRDILVQGDESHAGIETLKFEFELSDQISKDSSTVVEQRKDQRGHESIAQLSQETVLAIFKSPQNAIHPIRDCPYVIQLRVLLMIIPKLITQS